ncbi:LOW QUALITY PROTEIN: protein FAM221B [Acomys russatus]|uniref:LOW QUALITY PROTEIN: protein FAM221B n=1 Tax=Acomys russatus TaxID=60746 RepID=UPI0021E320C3|nr:LOW QUALITY PROTEIN: protein FAM221B [Acomys russatus]
MEANETTESPQTTADAKEQPYLESPSAGDEQEPETPSLQTSLQPPASEAFFETSASPNREVESSEDLEEPSVSETPLESHGDKLPSSQSPVSLSAQGYENLSKSPQSVLSLENTITEISLEEPAYETPVSKVPENSLQLSPTTNSLESPQKLSSEQVPQTQVESEHFPKHSLSGPSTQTKEDTSANQEEAGKDEPVVDTSHVTAHAATPEPSVAKKKEKKVHGNCPCLSPYSCNFGTVLDLARSRGLAYSYTWLLSVNSAPPFPGYTNCPVALKAQDSESLSKSFQSVASLEKAITEIPLQQPTIETLISTAPKNSLQLSPTTNSLESPHKLSSEQVPQTQVPESEHFPKHPLSGPSTQTKEDTSANQEEAGKNEPVVDTSHVTAHAATPEPCVAKKKEKRVNGYRSRPVVPAKREELVEVAKTMHREQFGAQVNNLFQWEKDSALQVIQTGLYIGWRCPHYLWDCFRIGDESKCFCGHLLKEHQIISDLSVPCSVSQCRCLMFCFIPSRPEEVGEFWLKRRATFDPKAWRAQCRCKHTHEEHAATGAHPCRHRGCACNCFESNFLCSACDRRWEEHETFFETKETRRRGGRPYGTDTANN